jgi:putative addiction module killer protein
MRYLIKEYKKFSKWIQKLDINTQDVILNRLKRLENGNFGDYKNIGDGVFELRIFFGTGYRIYFGIKNNVLIILINGGNKNSQKEDIILVKNIWKQIKNFNFDEEK